MYDGRVYQNKNAEFHKIPKATVIAALQQKNKEITCKKINIILVQVS